MQKSEKNRGIGVCQRRPSLSQDNSSQQLLALPSVVWHASKEDLLGAGGKTGALLRYALSKDFVEDQAYKRFCRFESYEDMLAFLQQPSRPPNLYELIPEALSTPVFLFFDLDRPLDPQCDADILQDPHAYLAQLLCVFESVFVRFLRQVYHAPEDLALELGRNYHAAHAISNSKLSCHIKINLVCPSVYVHKTVTQNLDKFMCSNLYLTPDERSYFYFYKAQKVTAIIDPAVYTHFRSFRTLYSSKLKREGAVPLLPFGASSADIRDHLVVAHAETLENYSSGDDRVIASMVIDARVADIHADFSRIKDAPIHMAIKTFSSSLLHSRSDNRTGEDACDDAGNAGCLSALQIHQIEAFLLNHPVLLELFGPRLQFKHSRFISPTVYVFYINKSCNCVCPYAGRSHKHNRSFFEYHAPSKTLQYKCFDEDCCTMHRGDKRILFRIHPESDALVRLSSMIHTDTLHCWQNVIPWNELYDAPDMLDYPLHELVGIRGNMGSAKTKVLIDVFIDAFASRPGCKCLFITYQRILSNKYAGALKCRGFVNYLECTEPVIHDPKVIVCLDSLWKVATRNFDFVFVDEVLSVLLHFNSPLMRQVQLVSSIFELLLLQARHVYLLDACVDNSMVYHFVQYLALRKNVASYWIRNTHVRPTNRRAELVVNKKKAMEKALRVVAVEKVIALLKEGKRVVVSSSTKSFTELLTAAVKEAELDKDVLVYHSGTDKALLQLHAGNTSSAWGQCDLLVYSPTISAGLSFEVSHFHQLVGYCENSMFTPSVDTVLQQLFRVRQLIEGHMTLFVNDTLALYEQDYPIQDADVEAWLDGNMAALCKYFPDNTLSFESASVVRDGSICYDRDRLSYHILKGILINKNRSLLRFTNVLTATLQEDYGIPCTVGKMGAVHDAIERAIELFAAMKRAKLDREPEFSSDLVICDDTFLALDAKKIRGEALTDREKLQHWIYQAATQLWEVPLSSVNAEFYQRFIGPCESSAIAKVFESFYRGKRLLDACSAGVEVHQEKLQARLMNITRRHQGGDYNLELFRAVLASYNKKLIEGQNILECLFRDVDGGYRVLLERDGGKLALRSKELVRKMKLGYLATVSDAEFKAVTEVFGIQRFYKNKQDVLDNDRKIAAFVKSILALAFEIEVESSVDGFSNKKTSDSYNDSLKFFHVPKWQELIFLWKVKCFHIPTVIWEFAGACQVVDHECR